MTALHVLVVEEEGDQLVTSIEHPDCPTYVMYEGDANNADVLGYACGVAYEDDNIGALESLRIGGTPVTEPGRYRVEFWSRTFTIPMVGTESETGLRVIEDAL